LKHDFESIGFNHFWGLSPCIDFLDKEFGFYKLFSEKDTVNVLLLGTSDIRHVLKTVADHCD